jgi:hypothetical protein
MTYNLPIKYNSRKSFYGKAKVEVSNGNQVLYSYGTKVAEIKNGKAKVYGTYSQTTLRHIKEFLLQNNYKAENSKQIMKDYGGDETYSEPISKTEIQPTISDVGSARVFRINDRMSIQAVSEKTRNGFRHIATLMVDGNEVDKSTANYLNRTWESYEYQSVIHDLINKSSYIKEKEELKKKFEETSHKKIESEFKTIGNIASLGNVFAKTKKEKNEWKLRMLKAGMEHKGFEVPENWDKLSEDEKEVRLDKAIKFLKKE